MQGAGSPIRARGEGYGGSPPIDHWGTDALAAGAQQRHHGCVKFMLPPPDAVAPRFLYLHGFASGPSSYKGTALCNHYDMRGVAVDRLNLRLPSFEHLR